MVTELKMRDNQVASFITLLRSMVQCSDVNQETLVREGAMATLGVLLQKVRVCCLWIKGGLCSVIITLCNCVTLKGSKSTLKS